MGTLFWKDKNPRTAYKSECPRPPADASRRRLTLRSFSLPPFSIPVVSCIFCFLSKRFKPRANLTWHGGLHSPLCQDDVFVSPLQHFHLLLLIHLFDPITWKRRLQSVEAKWFSPNWIRISILILVQACERVEMMVCLLAGSPGRWRSRTEDGTSENDSATQCQHS